MSRPAGKPMNVSVNHVAAFSVTDFESDKKESLILVKFSPERLEHPNAMIFAFTPKDGENLIDALNKALKGRIERKGH